jgi:hypothetical protein
MTVILMGDILTRESELSKAIERSFKEKGVASGREYPVLIQGKHKRVDVVSAKWTGEKSLEVTAVECKRGNDWEAAGQALNQAIAYQTLFPYVYVATQAPLSELEHMIDALRYQGLGYISVNQGRSKIELRASESRLLDNSSFSMQVLHRLGRFAACCSHWGIQNTRLGAGEGLKRPFISGKQIENCNYIYQFHDLGANVLRFGVNLESTRILRKLLSPERISELFNVLRKLPQNACLRIHDFEVKEGDTKKSGTKTKEKPFRIIQLGSLRRSDLECIVKHAEDVKHYVWLLVAKDEQPTESYPTRASLEDELRRYEKEFRLFYEYITTDVRAQK